MTQRRKNDTIGVDSMAQTGANIRTIRFRWDGQRVSQAVHNAAERGLRKGAEHMLAESKKHVPFKEGILENSGGVDSEGTKATVFYDTPYAVRLHEHPEFNFKGKGRGKWLELAVRKEQNNVIKIIRDEIKQVMRG